MAEDQRMTYDNTYYAIDAYIDSNTGKVIIKRDNRSAIVNNTDGIILRYNEKLRIHQPYITMRYAIALGLINEFMFERCC